MNNNNILFIGAGKMATAIAGGMIVSDFSAGQIKAFDVSKEAAEAFTLKTGVQAECKNLKPLIDKADTVILAVKPQHLSKVSRKAGITLNNKLVVSIAAGVKIERIKELTAAERIIRVMPNTPAMVNAGASAYALSDEVSETDEELVTAILKSIGTYTKLPESLMDAVTGVSGSGPAYVFDFIQAMADGGVNAGLPREAAMKLAAQTVMGAARLMLESGEHPAVLRDQVTSPGGTTAKALAVLESNSFKGIVIEAVLASVEHSIELGNK
ncbi:pyrroline-5-carboxylate reductase [Lentisphaerota bacterium ZTH]|nr:pyrroline-5-carboxylate reductase [Lentisphaerota bacterium]WET07523.1 pyrroline-5-carboxylate reductase [Lentisphaerota bacterium ZTH]